MIFLQQHFGHAGGEQYSMTSLLSALYYVIYVLGSNSAKKCCHKSPTHIFPFFGPDTLFEK
jgi:hypothetical protein